MRKLIMSSILVLGLISTAHASTVWRLVDEADGEEGTKFCVYQDAYYNQIVITAKYGICHPSIIR